MMKRSLLTTLLFFSFAGGEAWAADPTVETARANRRLP